MRRRKNLVTKTTLPDEDAQRIARDRTDLATFANVDFQRARFWCLSASVAAKYPRRLGADADPRELTVDKRISRKACYMYRDVWRFTHDLGHAPAPPEWSDWPIVLIDPLMNRIGATVRWETQVGYLINVVSGRMAKMTELEDIVLLDGMKKWYNKQTEVLVWELAALYRLQDFIETKRPAV